MKHDGRLTDTAGYAPTVRRRKLLTNLIVRAAERAQSRRQPSEARYIAPLRGIQMCVTAAPVGADSERFQAYVDWEEAWINAIKEERKCLNPTQYKAQQQRPMPPRYSRADLQLRRKISGRTP